MAYRKLTENEQKKKLAATKIPGEAYKKDLRLTVGMLLLPQKQSILKTIIEICIKIHKNIKKRLNFS